ncbi:MAG: WGxxGxxG family protein [Sphingomicrobium sp.]
MRNIFPLMIAVGLTAAAPAAAQVADNSANAADVAAPAGNDLAVTDNGATDAMTTGVANDMNALPAADQPVETTYTDTAPVEKSSFPWGVLGLLGLVGLMGRKRG